MKDEFEKVRPPVGAATQSLELRSKVGAVSAVRRYTAPVPAKEILADYRKELERNGWRFRSDFGDWKFRGQDYCKGNLLGSVEIVADRTTTTEYEFSVHWSGVSEKNCNGRTRSEKRKHTSEKSTLASSASKDLDNSAELSGQNACSGTKMWPSR